MDSEPYLCQFLDEIKSVPNKDQVDVRDVLVRKLKIISPAKEFSGSPILILTRKFDHEADLVGMKLLSEGIDYVRLNLEDIPNRIMLRYTTKKNSVPQLEITIKDEVLDLSKISTAWLRHFDINELVLGRDEPARTFSFQQWHAAFYIILKALKCRWINSPQAVSRANDRTRQLAVARASGFDIPPTLITNDTQAARKFYNHYGGNVIIKALHYHGIELEDKIYSMYTRSVSKKDLPKLKDLIYAPCILQEKLHKTSELRITVVGDRIFAAKLNFQSRISNDIHRYSPSEISIEAYEGLQPSTIKRCVMLIRSLGLRFGAIDFLVDKNDHLVFLEVNPAGDWARIEESTGLPITNAMADLIGTTLRQK